VATCPVNAKIGVMSTFASHYPVIILLLPDPAMAKQAAGLPVSFP